MPATTTGLALIAGLLIGESVNPLDASNCYIGVGDSSTAFSAAHTDLQAASNKHREIVDGAPGRSGGVLTFVATFETGDANFAWAEFGIFNAAAAGTMAFRKVESLGTKVSGDWTLTVTETLSI